MVTINENTLRDGSYNLGFKINEKKTRRVTSALDKAGFSIIEVGHGLGSGAYRKFNDNNELDEKLLCAAVEAREKAKISIFFIPGIGNKHDIKLASEIGVDLIRIGVNIDEYQKTRNYIEYAKELGMNVAVNGMKSYAVKEYEFSKIVTEIDSWGLADMLYLVDSAGCMTPDEVKRYITAAVNSVSISIGFHGHNNLSLAAINSIAAVQAGASYIDTCIRGMGRSAGNAQTEITVILLQKMGLCKNFDIYELYQIANQIIEPMMKRTQGLNDIEIHTGLSKFHSSFTPIIKKYSEKYNISFMHLMKEVSDVNCLNPNSNLIDKIAKKYERYF